ncbi:hypothetical protein R3P38DRAFT_2936897 [Favolaschia claudopus]|uniref:Uncharacterized protein n=1 Tax=Favolaschia claudopus TaxID=2862362 RepID=A0AAW0BQH0_9AGAR
MADYTVDSELFDTLWDTLKVVLESTVTALVLYGLYVNLFLLSLYILSHRNTAGTKILIAASCLMAIAGTTQIALTVAYTAVEIDFLRQVVHSDITVDDPTKAFSLTKYKLWTSLTTAQGTAFIVNYFVTCCIFLYRCYVVWGCRLEPIVLPALLSLSTAVIGGITCVASWDSITWERTACILAVATNLCLTAFTAGRIFWVQRLASALPSLDKSTSRRYNLAITVILESGAITLAVTIGMVIGEFLNVQLLAITRGFAQQLMNIIPTFTLVYVGLKNMADDSEAALESNTSVRCTQAAGGVSLRRRSRASFLKSVSNEQDPNATEGRV